MEAVTQRFCAVVVVALLAGCQVKAPPEGGTVEQAPGERLAPVVTTAFNIADYTGKVVLLDFWATWCPPCRSEIPALEKIHRDFKDRDLAVIGMSVDQDEPEQIQGKSQKLGISYPVVLADQKLQASYGGIRVVPTKFLIDRKGVVRKTYLGVIPENELRDQITALLAE